MFERASQIRASLASLTEVDVDDLRVEPASDDVLVRIVSAAARYLVASAAVVRGAGEHGEAELLEEGDVGVEVVDDDLDVGRSR